MRESLVITFEASNWYLHEGIKKAPDVRGFLLFGGDGGN
jgi:hypothetical protein